MAKKKPAGITAGGLVDVAGDANAAGLDRHQNA
jgi:hypothetical protein